jgi:hypothetical protein
MKKFRYWLFRPLQKYMLRLVHALIYGVSPEQVIRVARRLSYVSPAEFIHYVAGMDTDLLKWEMTDEINDAVGDGLDGDVL